MKFKLLGPLVALRDGRELRIGAAKQRALLAVLLLNAGETVSTDRLIDALWGERPPDTAAKALQVYVSQLRKALRSGNGSRLLVTRSPGYALELPEEALDVNVFERLCNEGHDALAAGDAAAAAQRLREALALWRGAPLADLRYEAFAGPHAARLEEQRLAALEDRIDADLALGRHAAVLGELEALVAEHPLQERLRGQLMLALYRSGRQADALAAFQGARRALVDELGIEPSRTLRDLERAILAQDASLDLLSAPEVADDEATRGVFVGRDAELAELAAALDAAVAGAGRLFLLAGEPGIGKSRITDEVARLARRRGAEVLFGRCWEAGGAPAYWPWVQSLRTHVERTETSRLRVEIGAGAAEIAQILPELRSRFDDASVPPTGGDGARLRLFDAVARFLRNAAAVRPLVIVLDDLHAADEPSLLLLRFVAAEIGDAHILVVGAYRDVDPTVRGPLASVLAELARERTTARIELGGLTSDDIARYIELSAHTTPDRALVDAISTETEGNPLFVGELVRLLASEGRLGAGPADVAEALAIPQGVREVIGRRVGRLSEQCGRLLTLASVLGREFPLDALRYIADLADDDLLETLDEAADARVLSSVPGPPTRLRFGHALIRETLYESMSPLRRTHVHRRVGETLETAYGSAVDEHVAELAFHFAAGQEFNKALDYARRAGDRALAQLAYEEGARLYVDALRAFQIASPGDDTTHCDLLLALGEARSRAGDATGATEAFSAAAELAERRALPRHLARAALGYGGRLVFARAGNDPLIVPLLERALERLGNADPGLRARVLARLSGALRDELSPARRRALSAEALALARTLGDDATLAYVLEGRCSALLGPYDREEQLELVGELVELSRRIGETERAAFGGAYGAYNHLLAANRDAADADIASTRRLAGEIRLPSALWMSSCLTATQALLDGRFGDAEQTIEDARVTGDRAQRLESFAAHSMHLYLLRRHQRRLAEIKEELDAAAAAFPARPVCRCVVASAAALVGDEDAARGSLAALAPGRFAAIPRDMEWMFAAALLAEVASWLSEAEAAAVLYDLLRPWEDATASNVPEGSLGAVARPLALVAATLGRDDEADRLFMLAAEVNQRLRSPVWLAYTRHDHAEMLERRGRPGDRARAAELAAEAGAAAAAIGIDALTATGGRTLR